MSPRGIDEMCDTEKITVGIDVFPSIFRMKNKILGDNNENVEYILNETGAVMSLRGKGSGFINFKEQKESDEPLHIYVRYKKLDAKEKTRELILNLIETVQQDFIGSTYGKYYSPPKKPEIIPVYPDKIRRTSSYNSIPSRSPARSMERDRPIERRSMEKRPMDHRNPPEPRSYDNRDPEPRPYENRGPEPRPYEKRPPTETRPYDNRPPEPRPYESRAPEPPRPYENRAPEPRPYENRAPEPPRPYDSRAPEPRPYDNRRPEPRPFENRTVEPRPYDSRPPETRPFESRAPEPRPSEPRPFDSRPESNSFENRPSEPRPLEKRKRESRFESIPTESAPVEDRPPDRRPVENPVPDSPKSAPADASSNIEKITIGIESVPAAFNLKSKIYGPNLANVKHIEKVANALLLVEGKGCGVNSSGEDSQEPPYILVKYLKPELKEVARSLIFNLVETIQQEYIQMYGRYPGGPQKPQIVPMKRQTNDNLPPDTTKVIKPSEITPVPPPPPVISKSSPDRFDNVPPPANYGMSVPKALSPKLFANAEPTPVPRPVQPVMPSTTIAYDPLAFQRLSESDPLPVASPLSSIASQSSILSSVLSTQPRLRQPGSFMPSETSPAQIQNIQYSEKRPKSPVESAATDPKRFCSAGVGTLNATPPNVFNVPNMPAMVQPRQTAPTPGKKNQLQRNLISIMVNKNNTAAPVAANSATTPLKPVPSPVQPPAKPPKAGILKKVQWNNVGNGKRDRSDSEDEAHNPIILSDSDDEEYNPLSYDRSSLRISATVTKNSGRDISVQTDDKLYQTQIKNVKCACGKFRHVVTGVRSVETQTIGGDSYRRF